MLNGFGVYSKITVFNHFKWIIHAKAAQLQHFSNYYYYLSNFLNMKREWHTVRTVWCRAETSI